MSIFADYHLAHKILPIGESPQGTEGAIPLPDIKETLKKKEEEERARIEEEMLKEKRRIKRSDKEAFTRVSFSLACFELSASISLSSTTPIW